ncbi:hypothetical protein FUAX_01440 [Fulvitalea axinellae]|uniref:Uncharacterized protein n=1 Tax=Fulvitalea axinellae TaxID=1182444 RepID=A0AAU9CLH0_9BACT|nr:hypothetical protein FUAX_01440 [Fulvitalea axinellae]
MANANQRRKARRSGEHVRNSGVISDSDPKIMKYGLILFVAMVVFLFTRATFSANSTVRKYNWTTMPDTLVVGPYNMEAGEFYHLYLNQKFRYDGNCFVGLNLLDESKTVVLGQYVKELYRMSGTDSDGRWEEGRRYSECDIHIPWSGKFYIGIESKVPAPLALGSTMLNVNKRNGGTFLYWPVVITCFVPFLLIAVYFLSESNNINPFTVYTEAKKIKWTPGHKYLATGLCVLWVLLVTLSLSGYGYPGFNDFGTSPSFLYSEDTGEYFNWMQVW